MELLTAFEGAVASTAEIVKSTPAGEMGAPTPCTEWDVRALLNHVIGTLWLAEGLFSDQAPKYPIAPGGLPATDLAGDDPAAAYAEASTAALAAAAAGDALTRVHVTPFGEMPGTWSGRGRHPGHPGARLGPGEGDGAADRPGRPPGRPRAELRRRGARHPRVEGAGMAASVPTAAGAPVTSRLAAFLGRQP